MDMGELLVILLLAFVFIPVTGLLVVAITEGLRRLYSDDDDYDYDED